MFCTKKEGGFIRNEKKCQCLNCWGFRLIKHFTVLRNKQIGFHYLMHVELFFQVAHSFSLFCNSWKRFKNTENENFERNPKACLEG